MFYTTTLKCKTVNNANFEERSLSIRVSKNQLEDLFKILRKDKTGDWKNKSEASRQTGFSRPTIDKILKAYSNGMPQKPKLTTPQFVSDYRESACHKKLLQIYTDKVTKTMTKQGYTVDRMGLDLYQ